MPAYLNDMPYWATLSYPDFQTRVTSQAFVACSRHDKKAETALPPTVDCQQLLTRYEDVVLETSVGHAETRLGRVHATRKVCLYTTQGRGEAGAGSREW